MGLPFRQAAKIGAYVVKKQLSGKKYPLVLMLEPLFRCNLACAGCGKIDYPDEILNQRMSYEQCMDAIDECGAPAVSIAGGEPLLHRDMAKIVEGYIARDKFVILHQCTAAGQEDRPVQAASQLHLVDPPGRRQGHARQVGVPGRHL
jgi:hopanoid biosynthesis associated radical SAM protein HpnH